MFGMIAAFVFVTGFAFAIGVIAWMFAHYQEKIVAALLVEPMPQTVRVYNVRISRPRVRPVQTARANPTRTALAA
ncbi:hypothetical protein BH11PSE5_BH11PSE5_31740 [soil metagenome]|uniref:hypothetical protein n=1 Tax=unclassified Sphingobium TaxID=2611147 RepID=UPI001E32A1E3|nr:MULTISPECIES: hypothetical protein [unclassified Sphingobium]GLI98575.1 hypothetical protein Sbs19_23930 [Sphingobium sp. BS19]CAH0352626.1 hypothetical protein SPH9361_02178 [Sphingobium sp. CECT 9361]|tara:strand:+ start:519 stop:743 length:225 start_codon:yes stop_codon:yes gene_type:complete